MKAYLSQLFAHVNWANRRITEALQSAPDIEQALKLLAHVLGAERIWLARLQGASTAGMEVWPVLSLEECVRQLEKNQLGYAGLIEGLTDEALEQEVAFTTTTGAAFRTKTLDILTHVALHGSYHRGQIMSLLSRAGVTTVNTDYIMYIREQ
ncbi:DinB family protein [Paenibacillus pinihumi]|uniref:DinB family protein n=1 Tax=Paenibacillus pinihumi TaxID=669462 RepID=UPI00042497D6|nr:DinB family protein [Paenibacillus pinihumi]